MNSTDMFQNAKAWPFEEARRILARTQGKIPEKGYVLLQTGYGPSGLPHIGTFGEVARTSMVRHAFETMSQIPTRLFSFSDDMDGLRKVPGNVPNQDMLEKHLGKPLTDIPDPYGQFESFGHHNNAMLRRFLDSFGFSYEFQSATHWYKSGQFDPTLRLVLQNYDAIMALILPTLRDERRQTYSPFLPICPRTGVVLQVPMVEVRPHSDTLVYRDPETNQLVEVLVTGGNCKLQWKVDWGMRWRAFDVDYEMSGKDLIDSVKLSSQVCRTLGGRAPESLICEMFLDEQGQKISKSKGNGLTIDEWLTYAPWESLAYYMYQAPRKAKRLYFDVIPKAVDEYLNLALKYETNSAEERLENPIYHIHKNMNPANESGLSFSILLNLASVCNAEDESILWGFVQRYMPNATPESMPFLNRLIHHALAYYNDFVKPNKVYRTPTEQEYKALEDLKAILNGAHNTAADHLQGCVFDVGKRHNFTDLRSWFGALYEVLLGQKEGPRMGSFIALYGVQNMVSLIDEKLSKS
jgi:lysyl-tRNA synthetase class 1